MTTSLPEKNSNDKGWITHLALAVGAFLIIAAGIGVIGLLFSPRLAPKQILTGWITGWADNLAAAWGLSPTLIKGLTIIATIPFFWALGSSWRNIAAKTLNPLRLYRDWRGCLVLIYIGAYFVLLGVARPALPKWCVSTPEGLKSYETQVNDPVYNLPTHRCTEQEIAYIRHDKVALPNPQAAATEEVYLPDPTKVRFFDDWSTPPRPFYWYSTDVDGAYHLYSHAGNDPLGMPLKPVTQQVVSYIISDYKSKRLIQQTVAQKSADAEKAAAQKKQDAEIAETAKQSLLAGDYEAAMKTCAGVLQIDPGDKDCQFVDRQSRMESASKLANAADDKFEEGDTAAAYIDASEALRLDPTNLHARKIRDLARTARKTTAALN